MFLEGNYLDIGFFKIFPNLGLDNLLGYKLPKLYFIEP